MAMNEHEEGSWLSAYIDSALSADERARLEAHLPECGGCRLELEALRGTKRRLAAAPKRAFPPDLLADLEQRWAAKPSRLHAWAGILWQGGARRWIQTGAMAMAVLIVGLGLWLKLYRAEEELPIEVLAAAHSRYSAEGLIPGDMVASNFSAELEQAQRNHED